MNEYKYRVVDLEEYYSLHEQFVNSNGDSVDGIIPDDEYDKLFDCIAEELNRIGKFVEGGTGEGEDFSSTRFVDQIPLINVVVEKSIAPEELIQAALRAIMRANRAIAYGFEWEDHYVTVFPKQIVIGTVNEQALGVPVI